MIGVDDDTFVHSIRAKDINGVQLLRMDKEQVIYLCTSTITFFASIVFRRRNFFDMLLSFPRIDGRVGTVYFATEKSAREGADALEHAEGSVAAKRRTVLHLWQPFPASGLNC
mgnify:CR=1 FL=1